VGGRDGGGVIKGVRNAVLTPLSSDSGAWLRRPVAPRLDRSGPSDIAASCGPCGGKEELMCTMDATRPTRSTSEDGVFMFDLAVQGSL